MSAPKPAKTWTIPHDMEPFIAEKCANGSYLVCNVCSVFDVDKRKYGMVRMRSPFWLGYFKDHLRSARHKENCVKKANHEEACMSIKCNYEQTYQFVFP